MKILNIPQTLWKVSRHLEYLNCLSFRLHAGFLAKQHIAQSCHHPCSTDFIHCNLWPFPKLNSLLEREFKVWTILDRMWRSNWLQFLKRTLQIMLKSRMEIKISLGYTKQITLKKLKGQLLSILHIFIICI